MVRLKAADYLLIFTIKPHFNSTMVRLKAESCFTVPTGTYHFNSTMVRLKAVPKGCWLNLLIFQFHYGTIKSKQRFFHEALAYIFQFHYGTIKRKKKMVF